MNSLLLYIKIHHLHFIFLIFRSSSLRNQNKCVRMFSSITNAGLTFAKLTTQRENPMKSKDKKSIYLLRSSMMILTTVLIILFFCIMSLVGKIQGTARVVNYAGLVRGCTQRIIKLEDAGTPRDDLIETVSSIIDGLRNNSDSLNLVRLNDKAFQTKMDELSVDFEDLKSEIYLVREKGYENTSIIEKSENFFQVCDEATGLAEAYSQRKATSLDYLEKIVIVIIIGLVFVIGTELIKALRFAAQNRILQKKVYLDEATGLPNKNKCEEILDDPTPPQADTLVSVCVFDLNNLRTINNNLGHDKGDEYIRTFAIQLRKAVPEEWFVGRDGGDEFIAVFTGADHPRIRECLENIRTQCQEYSVLHPEMPLSYAAGYALSSDFPGDTMRELFRYADKNMYIDKNQAKIQEAQDKQNLHYQLLDFIKKQNFHFSACLYCDALLDQYDVLRASSGFFLAEDGSYSGAVEQIVHELSTDDTRMPLWEKLQADYLGQHLNKEQTFLKLPFQYEKDGCTHYGRITALFSNETPDGRLHHFILGFENFHTKDDPVAPNEKTQLLHYYEQMKQSILENGSYVDALMENAQVIYSVDLTHDTLENIFYHTDLKEFDNPVETPCSYDLYCQERSAFVTEDTLENYRIVDSSRKLLERFQMGSKQITVEYMEINASGTPTWLQKTVLMSQDTQYDSRTHVETRIVHGIILYKNTSLFHEKEREENKRLQVAVEKADSENKAKTVFLNRMSHDIRTPINGIMGMLEIINKNRKDDERVDDCLNKIHLSTRHLLALVNDVLDMNKLEDSDTVLPREPFDLKELTDEVAALIDGQLVESKILHRRHRENVVHTDLVGSPLQLRQIMLNLFSNAIKYNKPDGTIDTYAKELSFDGKNTVFEFKIQDTGIGMSEDFVQNQLFKPFTQEKADARTQYRGTGLGMSIVKALVEKMDGEIEVHSVLNKGTTYVFRIQFEVDTSKTSGIQSCDCILSSSVSNSGSSSNSSGSEPSQDLMGISTADCSTAPVTPALPLAGMHILLAEDNDINMEIAEFYLTDCGATVNQAWNGQEAVEKFQNSAPGTYQMILMDVMMPVLDGLAATRTIRALSHPDAKSIPILAMTAQTSPESIIECREAGMNEHIGKPIEEQQLIRILEKFNR